MNQVLVRTAAAGDVPAIVALWRESMTLHGSRDPAFHPRADGHLIFERFITERLASSDATVMVAEVGGKVAAYGVCVLRTRPDYFEPGEHGLITGGASARAEECIETKRVTQNARKCHPMDPERSPANDTLQAGCTAELRSAAQSL